MYLLLSTGEPIANQLSAIKRHTDLVTLDQYVNNLRHLTSLGFDAGHRDAPGIRESVETLHQELNAYAIPHVFTVYRGTHQSAVAQRFRDVLLPFVMSAFKKEEERTHE
jgi:enterochelin esterase-like enzyme